MLTLAVAFSRLPPRAAEASSAAFASHYAGGEPALDVAIRQQWAHRPSTTDDTALARFDALGPVVQCPASMLLSFGKGDDEKRVCGSVLDSPCTVLSIGSNNQWGFERAVAAAMPACRIHTLDCTVDATVPPGLRSHVTFHPICLGEKDVKTPTGSRYASWATLVSELALTRPPTMLKMDVEGFEWDVLEALVRSGAPLLPFSISVELHVWTEVKEVAWQGRWRGVHETGAWMRTLLARGGYALVDRHDNPLCSYCSEVVLARLLAPEAERPRRSRLRSHRRRRMREERGAVRGLRWDRTARRSNGTAPLARGGGARSSIHGTGPHSAGADGSSALIQNMIASLLVLTLAFLGARRLNRFLKEILA